MATYAELYTLGNNNILLDRITVAITVAATTIVNEDVATTNHANRLVWAKTAFVNPKGQSKDFLNAVLAVNKGATTETIEGSSDVQIQTNVDSVVDIFAGV